MKEQCWSGNAGNCIQSPPRSPFEDVVTGESPRVGLGQAPSPVYSESRTGRGTEGHPDRTGGSRPSLHPPREKRATPKGRGLALTWPRGRTGAAMTTGLSHLLSDAGRIRGPCVLPALRTHPLTAARRLRPLLRGSRQLGASRRSSRTRWPRPGSSSGSAPSPRARRGLPGQLPSRGPAEAKGPGAVPLACPARALRPVNGLLRGKYRAREDGPERRADPAPEAAPS